MQAKIFGSREIFGPEQMRELNPDRIAGIGNGIRVVNTHQHLGSAFPLRELYKLGVSRGIHGMPKGVQEFISGMVQIPHRGMDLGAYLAKAYHLAEEIQSGPQSVEKAVRGAVEWAQESTGLSFLGSDFGQCRVFDFGGIEVRFDPMKRNELQYSMNDSDIQYKYDLDAIISSADIGSRIVHSVDFKVGFVICLAKDIKFKNLSGEHQRHTRNIKLAEKISVWAEKYPVFAVDIAGDERYMTLESEEERTHLKEWYDVATQNGKIKKTIHIGETPYTSVDTFIKVIELVEPERIGHGTQMIKNALEGDSRALECAKKMGCVFELCLYSNLATGVVANVQEFNLLAEELHRREIPYVFATDGTCAHSFDEDTTSKRNGHHGVTLADEIVMMHLGGASDEVLRTGLLNTQTHTFLRTA